MVGDPSRRRPRPGHALVGDREVPVWGLGAGVVVAAVLAALVRVSLLGGGSGPDGTVRAYVAAVGRGDAEAVEDLLCEYLRDDSSRSP